MSKNKEPFFGKNSVKDKDDILIILAYKLMFALGITEHKWCYLCELFHDRNKFASKLSKNSFISNQTNAYKKDRITFKSFLTLIHDILRLEFVSIDVTFKHKGKIIKISSLDDMANKEFGYLIKDEEIPHARQKTK